jgi:predicted hotdog family 3-hydroxylacyl-ACP dehydratase
MAANLPFYKNKIEQLVPHSGTMCLIDRVDYWDEQTIRCASTSHQDPDNPLRLDGKLSSIHLLEYGAQAMAIHGGLLAEASTPGVLAAVRDVSIIIDEIDHITDEIIISATVEIITETGAGYQFVISDSNSNTLLKARATIIKHRE